MGISCTLYGYHMYAMGITYTRAGHYIGVVDVQKEQKC